MVNVRGRDRRPAQKATAGFVYRPRSADSVKKRAEQKGGRFDSIFKSDVDTWRPKSGTNRVRILPPTWDDFEHYGYRVYVHRFVGPDNSTYLCPSKMMNKKCPICRIAKETRDGGDEDEAKKLQAAEQFAYYILDRDAKGPPRPELWTVSWTMDRDIAKLTIDSRTGKILLIDHPDDGFDLTFDRDGMGMKTKYSAYRVDREASSISEDEAEQEEILTYISEHPISDVLQFYPADYLQSMMDGTGGGKDEDLDEEETTTKAKSNGKRRVVEEDEEEETTTRKTKRRQVEEDEGETEEEDEAPKSKRRRSEPEDEPEEDDDPPPKSKRRQREEPEDEPEEEDDPPPKSKKRRQAEEESEDEEEDDPPPKSKRRRAEPEEEDDPPPKKGRARREEPEDAGDDDGEEATEEDEEAGEEDGDEAGEEDEDDEPKSRSKRGGSVKRRR